MSNAQALPPPPAVSNTDSKVLPVAVYVLYLLGFLTHGATTLVGVILAYVFKTSAPPVAYSHYVFLIRTFWLTLLGALVFGTLLAIGIPLSFVIVGIPFAVLGGLGLVALVVWHLVRVLVGLVRIASDEPYPTPRAWLL